jgi:ribosomal 50S subunit-recycling heat shock protein
MDGSPVKPSRQVRPGAVIHLDLPSGPLDIQVLNIPVGNLSKRDVLDYYRVLKDERGSKTA